ncbi:MAG TPA: LemA family protein [Candidatus Nanoarchaeia archaeon]|nr:LemA family protein [Candidatus Nanoarchaeia archaeon]
MKKQQSTGKYWAIGIIAVVVLVLLWMFGTYNSLVGLQESVKNGWADVETQYQRRADLIPNLVETVKGYASHEKNLFEDVAKMRSAWANAKESGIDAQIAAAKGLDGVLGRLIAVAENYPDLKASQNFLALQDQLEGTENRVSVARTRYNEVVRTYNTKIKRVPGNIVAGWFDFTEKQYFESTAGAEQVPQVKFL